MGAGSHAISAANALSVIGGTKHIHIHLAYPAACAAGGALVRIHRQPVDRDPVAQAVKGPQRAQPFTERTVEEHRQHHNSQQDAALPCEEPAQTGTDAGVGQGQGDAALQNTGGAEIFAEERIPHPHLVHHRHGQDDDKEDQDPIFQISEDVELADHLRQRQQSALKKLELLVPELAFLKEFDMREYLKLELLPKPVNIQTDICQRINEGLDDEVLLQITVGDHIHTVAPLYYILRPDGLYLHCADQDQTWTFPVEQIQACSRTETEFDRDRFLDRTP